MPKFKDGDILIVPNGLNVNSKYLRGPFMIRYLTESIKYSSLYDVYPINDFNYFDTIYNMECSFYWDIKSIDGCAVLYEPEKPKKAIFNRLKNL